MLTTSVPDVIVITGAGGFLGSRVVPMIRRYASGARVIAVTRQRRSAPAAGVEALYGDLRSPAVWRSLPRRVTHVVHLAAAIPWDPRTTDDARIYFDNLAPVAELLRASERWADLRQVVYGSSVSVYASSRRRLRESSPLRPPTTYGAAKLAGEGLLETLRPRGIATASLRYSSIYGVGQYAGTVLPILVERARRGLPLVLFNPRRVQDFLHVDDAAQGTWLACRKRTTGAFNVGSGRSVTMSILAREILDAFDESGAGRVVVDPPAPGDSAGWRIDIARARQVLGYRPVVRLRDGLRRLARENPS